MSRVSWSCMLLLTLMVLQGCGAESSTDDADTAKSNSAGKATEAAPTKVDVVVASWDELQSMVKQHEGKVVVVDLWSSFCAPCIREFPNLVALHESYPDHVACISVCLNYDGSKSRPPESHLERVTEFLTKQNAQFENVLCSDSDLDLYDRIELSSIPAVYVYDRQGELSRRFDNEAEEFGDEGFTYQEHIVPLVEELLE